MSLKGHGEERGLELARRGTRNNVRPMKNAVCVGSGRSGLDTASDNGSVLQRMFQESVGAQLEPGTSRRAISRTPNHRAEEPLVPTSTVGAWADDGRSRVPEDGASLEEGKERQMEEEQIRPEVQQHLQAKLRWLGESITMITAIHTTSNRK